MTRILAIMSVVTGLMVAAGSGCSASGAAFTALRMGKNASKKDSYLRIYLDGVEAKQNKLKKAYFGHASFKAGGPVSTSPTFRFEFKDPSKFGRITGTNMQIHQEFEADYSHQAEYMISPRGSGGDSLMKPGVDYALGSIGSQFRVLDFEKNETGGVNLKPGMDYLLVFSVTGDRSETIQVKFDTK